MVIEKDGIKQEGTPIEDLELDKLKDATDAFSNVKDDEEKKGEETPADSSTENKDEKEKTVPPTDDKKGEDDKIPFHKHPRFKELIDSNKTLKEQNEQLVSRIEDIEKSKKEDGNKKVLSSADSELLGTFEQLYGTSDPYAFELWKQATIKAVGYNEETLIQKAKERIKEEKANEDKELEKWKSWVKERINEVIDNGEVLAEDENALKKVMEDYSPTDTEGNLNFHKGAELLKLLKQTKPDKSSERKKLAGQITARSSGSDKNDNVQSNVTLRNKSMSDLARE
jgi:hypothetical protein